MDRYHSIIIAAFLFAACSSGGKDVAFSEPEEKPIVQEVETPAEEGDRILVSKGVIRSANEVNVFSRIEGQLMDVRLFEGQAVRKGQVLFTLDDWELKGKVLMSESNLEQAQVRMEEILIGQGYKRGHFEEVPENVKSYAMVKSGLNVARRELELNQARLARTVITAPMSGSLTAVSPLPYSYVNPGETLCKIVDSEHLVVEFSILETELGRFKVDSVVDVCAIAYSDVHHSAKVRTIGTVVDESGMVRLVATIQDCTDLLPGMTAIVSL